MLNSTKARKADVSSAPETDMAQRPCVSCWSRTTRTTTG